MSLWCARLEIITSDEAEIKHAGTLILGRRGPVPVSSTGQCLPSLNHLPVCFATQIPADIQKLKDDVEAFATRFPTIGFEKANMRYKD